MALGLLWMLASGIGKATTLPIDPAWTIQETLVLDVDRNERSDLILGLHKAASGERAVEVWLRGDQGHQRDPIRSAVVPEDTVAFAFASIQRPERELVIFTARAAYLHARDAKEESARWVRLFSTELLWSAADPEQVFHIQPCIRDFDGDGLDEFLLPEHQRYAFYRRNAAREWTVSHHAIEAAALEEPFFRAEVRNEDRAAQRFARIGRKRADPERNSSWLALSTQVPAPVFADIDGDGLMDVSALTEQRFFWWKQVKGVGLDPAASTQAFPLASKELRVLDLTRSVRIQDLNGDKRADALAFAPGNSEKNQTQVLVWLGADKDAQAKLFPGEKRPDQALILDGIAQAVALHDIDGNGYPDLVARALKPDLIDILRSAASEELELQVHVFLNNKGSFSRKPDLTWDESMQAGDDGGSGAIFQFLGDITGDGVSELVLRSKAKSARIMSLRKSRDGKLTRLEKALWEADMSSKSLLVPDRVRPQAPDVYWYSKEGITCLSLL